MSRRILITGGAGFIGSHLVRHCLARGWHVTVLDRLDPAGSYSRLQPLCELPVGDRLRIVFHDLRAEIKHSELGEKYDYVAHLAAGSHVDRSTLDPCGYVLDNVLGTAHLLEYCRTWQRQARILHFSTDEVFGPAAPNVEFGEHARFEPENHYAATKAGAEALCPAYAHQCGLQIIVTHCCNVYGPMQHAEKFIPTVVAKVLAGDVLQIHSRDGKPATRLFLHVDDCCEATLTALERGGAIADDRSGRYNIVAAAEIDILDAAKAIAGILDRELRYELVERPPNRLKPDMRYAMNGAKLAALGWRQKVDFETGLKKTVEELARTTTLTR